MAYLTPSVKVGDLVLPLRTDPNMPKGVFQFMRKDGKSTTLINVGAQTAFCGVLEELSVLGHNGSWE